MPIDRESLDNLGHILRGTCKSIHEGLECAGIEDNGEDWEDELLNVNTEQCSSCGWWFESCELVNPDDDEDIGRCDQCREE